MKKILTFLMITIMSMLPLTSISQDEKDKIEDFDNVEFQKDGVDISKDYLASDTETKELQSFSLSDQKNYSSSSRSGGGNKSIGPALMLGGLIFGTIGVLGGTLGGDYEGATANKKPFYKQGAHFFTAVSGGIAFTAGLIITL
jgi:hypothetical protein